MRPHVASSTSSSSDVDGDYHPPVEGARKRGDPPTSAPDAEPARGASVKRACEGEGEGVGVGEPSWANKLPSVANAARAVLAAAAARTGPAGNNSLVLPSLVLLTRNACSPGCASCRAVATAAAASAAAASAAAAVAVHHRGCTGYTWLQRADARHAADVRAELAAAGQAGPADDVIRDVAVALVDELGRGTFDMARAVATWKRCLQLALQLLFHGAIQVLRGDDAERRVRVRDALDAFFNKKRMANHLAQLGRFLAGNLRSLDPERCPNPVHGELCSCWWVNLRPIIHNVRETLRACLTDARELPLLRTNEGLNAAARAHHAVLLAATRNMCVPDLSTPVSNAAGTEMATNILVHWAAECGVEQRAIARLLKLVGALCRFGECWWC